MKDEADKFHRGGKVAKAMEAQDEGKNYWEGLHPFEALPDRTLGVVVPTAEKVLRLWGEVRMQEPRPDRSIAMTNFVSSIDGVGSYGIEGYSGGGALSLLAADRWVMDIGRTHADAVLLGAETVRAEDREFKKSIANGKLDFRIDGEPVNGFAVTVEDPELADWRLKNKGERHPMIAIFSGSGELPEDAAIFDLKGQRIVIFTTPEGAKKLEAMTKSRDGFANTNIVTFTGERGDLPRFALETLKRDFKVDYVMAEGGPSTIGDFLKKDLMDEILVTTAPRLAYGKDGKGNPRKRIFEGRELNFFPQMAFSDPDVALPPDAQPSFEYEELSFRRYGDHNFTRYWRKRE